MPASSFRWACRSMVRGWLRRSPRPRRRRSRPRRRPGTTATIHRAISLTCRVATAAGARFRPSSIDSNPPGGFALNLIKTTAPGLAAVLTLSACAAPPMGPTVAVMPGPNKPFDVFQQDQALCKDYANQQVAGGAERANNQAVGGAAIGTLLAAGLGAP